MFNLWHVHIIKTKQHIDNIFSGQCEYKYKFYLCVCTVQNHRWRQSVKRTKSTTRDEVEWCDCCSLQTVMSSVIYYSTHSWKIYNIFAQYNNNSNYFIKYFFCEGVVWSWLHGILAVGFEFTVSWRLRLRLECG